MLFTYDKLEPVPPGKIDISRNESYLGYCRRIASLLREPAPLVPGKRNELQCRNLCLSPESERLYIAFHDRIERDQGPGGTLEPIRGLASKSPEHALRLAGVLCLFSDIRANEIIPEQMAAGIALSDYYINESLRLFGANHIAPDLILAKKTLTWLTERKKTAFHLSELYQSGPPEVRSKADAHRICKILVEHNELMALPVDTELDGKKRKTAYLVRTQTKDG